MLVGVGGSAITIVMMVLCVCCTFYIRQPKTASGASVNGIRQRKSSSRGAKKATATQSDQHPASSTSTGTSTGTEDEDPERANTDLEKQLQSKEARNIELWFTNRALEEENTRIGEENKRMRLDLASAIQTLSGTSSAEMASGAEAAMRRTPGGAISKSSQDAKALRNVSDREQARRRAAAQAELAAAQLPSPQTHSSERAHPCMPSPTPPVLQQASPNDKLWEAEMRSVAMHALIIEGSPGAAGYPAEATQSRAAQMTSLTGFAQEEAGRAELRAARWAMADSEPDVVQQRI